MRSQHPSKAAYQHTMENKLRGERGETGSSQTAPTYGILLETTARSLLLDIRRAGMSWRRSFVSEVASTWEKQQPSSEDTQPPNYRHTHTGKRKVATTRAHTHPVGKIDPNLTRRSEPQQNQCEKGGRVSGPHRRDFFVGLASQLGIFGFGFPF